MKEECDSIICNWQMTFQALDFKRKHFLKLLNNDYCSIKLTYIKDSTWINLLGHSNSLYVRATRAITNYASIGEYYLRFFSKEDFSCPYENYPIESRHHILHKYRRYNNF